MLGDIRQARNLYLVCGYTDMRREINGLAAIVEQNYHMDPFGSGLFLFCGRRRDQIKTLLWEPDGFVLLYKYAPSRWDKVAQEMLEGFSGCLQTDGYSGYNSVEDVTRVGCWAHVRRKWVDCFPNGVPAENSISKQAFELVGKLFCAEKELKQQDPTDWKQPSKMIWILLDTFCTCCRNFLNWEKNRQTSNCVLCCPGRKPYQITARNLTKQ